MREICCYTILILFCSVPLAAQEVPFEGLHLDDLISVPGEARPGTFKFPLTPFALSDIKTCRPDKSLLTHQKSSVLSKPYTIYPNVTPKFKLTDKWSLSLSTNSVSDRHRSLRNLYTVGVDGGLTYGLTKNFQLKAGGHYQYNIALHRWEWACMTGITFSF